MYSIMRILALKKERRYIIFFIILYTCFMRFENPILRGFYPDPSVCRVGNKYYLVCSSFQYFPGVPIFESDDLINWTQIGHCLTRESQLPLEGIESSGGVFAPTIRHHEGRYYMVTTNATFHKHFYVYTDDIYGEWSEPIFVDQGGIDPSLFFEDGKAYFTSNGADEEGKSAVIQCEIEIETGKRLTESKHIWHGSGGKYLESPHLYKIKDYYYLTCAEGGTEYGHMITVARSKSPYGPFEGYPNNPVLTNRNLGGYEIQGIGHGDLFEDTKGNWWLIHLGFRQTGQWLTYHHLGREVFIVPIQWQEDGWFTANEIGITEKIIDTDLISYDVKQKLYEKQDFKTLSFNLDWAFLRNPKYCNYDFSEKSGGVKLRGDSSTINDIDPQTFIGIRQKEFCNDILTNICFDTKEVGTEAGITAYMDENHHYDIAIIEEENENYVILRLCIGDLKSIVHKYSIGTTQSAKLLIKSDNINYYFYYADESGDEHFLGKAQTRYLSSEVAGGFTGVLLGLYATGNGIPCNEWVHFKEFSICPRPHN